MVINQPAHDEGADGDAKTDAEHKTCADLHPGFCRTRDRAWECQVMFIATNLHRHFEGQKRPAIIGNMYEFRLEFGPKHCVKFRKVVMLSDIRFSNPRWQIFTECIVVGCETDVNAEEP